MAHLHVKQPGTILETLTGIVDRVTYHNPDNGWSVLRVLSFDHLHHIDSPLKDPELWSAQKDCLFIDSDEATREQLNFIAKVKRFHEFQADPAPSGGTTTSNPYEFRVNEPVVLYETELTVPSKFRHVDWAAVCKTKHRADELLAVLKKVHPWSSLHYGLAAADGVKKTLHRVDPQILWTGDRNSDTVPHDLRKPGYGQPQQHDSRSGQPRAKR